MLASLLKKARRVIITDPLQWGDRIHGIARGTPYYPPIILKARITPENPMLCSWMELALLDDV
jgi:hypothetical protein